MIKGAYKKEFKLITWDEVLSLTHNGLDIFKYEIGSFPLGKPFNSPLRKDKSPSFVIFFKGEVFLYKDFSTGESGSALQFIQKKYGYTFKEALNHMVATLGLENNNIISVQKVSKYETKEIHIAFTEGKYDSRHAAYWNSYHLSTDFLKRNDVYRVKALAIDHKKVILKPDELTFAYYAPDVDKCKILRIGVEKKDKWRNNVPGNYLWYSKGLHRCDTLMICKSVKDSLVLKNFGLCSVSTQSENARIFDSNADVINSISNNVYVCFGSDAQGKEQSLIATEKHNYKHYNTPDEYLEFGVNDPAEFAKYNIKLLEEHLKSKGIL
jgi:hypothetical protein